MAWWHRLTGGHAGRERVGSDTADVDPARVVTEALFQEVPVEKPSWLTKEASELRAGAGLPTATVDVISTRWPPTKPNGPFFSSTGEQAFCLIRLDVDDAEIDAYLDAVRKRKYRLTITTFLYPTYPILQFVLRIQPAGWSTPWYHEIIGNITDEDIQTFVQDACRSRRWTLVLAQYDPTREQQTSRMINCLEAAVPLSDVEMGEFVQAAQTAASHFADVPAAERGFNAAASQFLADSPSIDTAL